MKNLALLTIVIVFLQTAGQIVVRAETLVWGTNQVVSLNVSVQTNQMMVVTALNNPFGASANSATNVWWQFIQGTNALNVTFADRDAALTAYNRSDYLWVVAGPMNVQLQGSGLPAPLLLSYKLVPIAGVQTALLSPAMPSCSVNIMAGQRLTILSAPYISTAFVNVGGTTAELNYISGAAEGGVGGPAEVTFTNAGFISTKVFSYSLLDESVAALPSGALSIIPSGMLGVEKSTNLTNWVPSSLILNNGSPNAYYRLRAGD